MSATPAERLSALAQYVIRYEDLVFNRQIGCGSFGDVWMGTYAVTGEKVAIKKLHRRDGDPAGDEAYCREIETLATARHRFILPFVGFTKTFPFCVVTKFIENDSLFNALREDPKGLHLTPTDLTVIAYGMAAGMAFLHSKNLIHRDLKSQNILLDENKCPVICDFGSSRRAMREEELKTGECGTPNYMAPEFIQAVQYNNKVDVFSYSMILWEMLTRVVPYENLNAAQAICQIIMGRMPPIPESTPEPLARLILAGWERNPDDRPTFDVIAQSFKSGEVAFAGCDPIQFRERCSGIEKKRSLSQLPRFRTKQNYMDGSRSPDLLVGRCGPKCVPSPDMSSMLGTQVQALSDMDSTKVMQSINYIMAHIDEAALLQYQFWPPILRILKCGQKDLVDLAIPLSVRLAQSSQRLALIASVQDLHMYVCPASMELFLYIVSHQTRIVTEAVTSEIINLVQDEAIRKRAIILLCKLINRTDNKAIGQSILKTFLMVVNSLSEFGCGALVLRILINHSIVNDDTIALYLASRMTDNIVAGYQALFIQERLTSVSPNLNRVESLLVHLQTDNDQLRAAALEFVRRYAMRVDGNVLSQIVDALLTNVLRYSSEKAVLLLCKFACDPQRARVILSPGSTSIWLFASSAKAVRMMRVFSVLFKQQPLRAELMQIPEVTQFLVSVLETDDVEPFLAVCWAIRIADSDRDFLVRLNQSEVTDGLCTWLLKTTDTRPIQGATSALASIAECGFSHAFERAVPRLVKLVTDDHPATLHCLMLLAKISEYRQTMGVFLEANVFSAIAKASSEEMRCYIDLIVRNLERAGLTIA